MWLCRGKEIEKPDPHFAKVWRLKNSTPTFTQDVEVGKRWRGRETQPHLTKVHSLMVQGVDHDGSPLATLRHSELDVPPGQ